MDEVFGEENFVQCISVVNDARTRSYEAISGIHEYILIYAKNEDYSIYQISDENKEFQYTDENGGFDIYELRNRNTQFNADNRPNLFYAFYIDPSANPDNNGLYNLSLEKKE